MGLEVPEGLKRRLDGRLDTSRAASELQGPLGQVKRARHMYQWMPLRPIDPSESPWQQLGKYSAFNPTHHREPMISMQASSSTTTCARSLTRSGRNIQLRRACRTSIYVPTLPETAPRPTFSVCAVPNGPFRVLGLALGISQFGHVRPHPGRFPCQGQSHTCV